MNKTTRRTRACTMETMDEKLGNAIRDHGAQYGLADLESDVLMCCETIPVQQKKGFFGGIKTTLSAVYVTRKWLVWAESSQVNDAIAGTAQLKHIDVIDYSHTARYSISPDQRLHVTGLIPIRTGQVSGSLSWIQIHMAKDFAMFSRKHCRSAW